MALFAGRVALGTGAHRRGLYQPSCGGEKLGTFAPAVLNPTAPPTPRLALAALALGLAAWAQLSLTPVLAGAVDALSMASSAAALAVLASAAWESRRHPAHAVGLAAGAFPAALGVAAFFAGRHAVPRYDAASRAVAAVTAVAYFVAVLRWFATHRAVIPLTATLADDRPRNPAPPFRNAALACLAVVAAMTAVVAPAILGAREPATVAERIAGESLLRGRGALVAAVGTALALAVALHGGASVVRAAPPRVRSTSRATAYVLWAVCALAMRAWLDRTR